MATPLRSVVRNYIGGGWGKETSDASYVTGAFVIRGTDFEDVSRSDVTSIPFRYHKRTNARSRVLQDGDIVFEVSGGSKDQPVGRSILITPQRLKKFSAPAIPASFCKRISPDKSLVEPRYLHAHLQLAWLDRRIVQWQVQSTGISNFKFESFLDQFEIWVPSLPVQQRIAAILSPYDQLIENSQRRIRILESMARALYREWFVHFRFPGHEAHPRVASPVGEIPEGWTVRKLGDIAEEMRRNVPKGYLDEPQPYVGLEHIPRRSLALDAWEIATELGSNKLEFKKDEVLFGKIRPYFHKVSVAPFDGLCSADTIVIRARQSAHYAFVVACASSDGFVAHASATANGAKMPRANWNVLKNYEVVVPSGEFSVRFSTLFVDIIARQQALVFQIQNLRRTRDLLLPRLLSGQVDLEVEAA